MKYLTEELELNSIDAADPDIADMNTIPDHIQLSRTIKMCLQESEVEQSVHGDFVKLPDSTLQFIGLENWPEAIKSYERLGLKHELLTLVPPIFEVPQPPLQPATFPPAFREIQPPQLELFDLDDAFTSTEQRLAQLTNRCAEQELDLFVREAGELIGIGKHVTARERGAKRVLERVLREIMHYKCSGLDDSDVPGGGGLPYDFHQVVGEGGVDPADHDNNIMAPVALVAMESYEGEEGVDGADYFSDIDEYDNMDMAEL
jgi:intraflagellar transport protein 52